jgi:hypothetical protein
MQTPQIKSYKIQHISTLKFLAMRLIPIFILAFGGCFFGTFQTAEPVKQGEMDAGLYLNFSFPTHPKKNPLT